MGWERWKKVKGGHMMMEGDSAGAGEHTVQCTDDVFWSCAPETCTFLLILLTKVTPINSIKIYALYFLPV